ncbi:MAG TPA: HemK/PrmC family methyltransferase [Candidatus Saccharimonadales bacterium]
MTVGEFLKNATADFAQAGIESARLDALLLLEDALKQDRALLLAYEEHEIPAAALSELDKKRTQRAAHIPMAYIRGSAPFYGREFAVNEHVLVPRPESEALIDLLKAHAPNAEDLHIADVGTGSGCLGITAVLELPNARATLLDIDASALAVAQKNASRWHAETTAARHDLLHGAGGHYDIVLANLPYVPEAMQINAAAMHEPAQAIFSGPDGLDHYKRLWEQLRGRTLKPALVITESLTHQHHANAQLARAAGYYLDASQDLGQAFRLMA